MAQILVLAVLALAACAGPVHAAPGAGPALGVFPPNATLVTAKVMRQGTTTADYLPSQSFSGSVVLTLSGIYNPAATGATGSFPLATTTAAADPIDSGRPRASPSLPEENRVSS